MIFCSTSPLFQSSSCDCANFVLSFLGLCAISCQVYFIRQSSDDLDGASDNAKRYIYLYKALTVICFLLTVAIAVVSIGLDGTDVVSFFLTIAIRLFGWTVSFKYAADIALRSKSRLLFCAAMWSLTQVIGSGLSVSTTESADSGLVENLSMGYCLLAIGALVAVSYWLCRYVQ